MPDIIWTKPDRDGVVEEIPAQMVKAIEQRADVDSLAMLHAKRRALIEKHGRILALFGNFGLWDAYRKQRVEAAKVAARMRLSEAKEKVTDDRVDAEAHASPEYAEFLDRMLADKILCITVSAELDEISDRIHSREAELRFATAEVRLQQ